MLRLSVPTWTRTLLVTAALASSGASIAHAQSAVAPGATLEEALCTAAPDLDPHVLALALEAQSHAVESGLVSDATTLTVIDYSRPSTEQRFYVFDVPGRKLLFHELVAHGKNSGENLATRFSNVMSSFQTSLGLFVTLDSYVGEHGLSLRLEGLEPGFNDRAKSRAIVMHGADYVSGAFAAREGRLGRSWGCPALPTEVAASIIERIAGGSAVFAYGLDERWLQNSRFLTKSIASL